MLMMMTMAMTTATTMTSHDGGHEKTDKDDDHVDMKAAFQVVNSILQENREHQEESTNLDPEDPARLTVQARIQMFEQKSPRSSPQSSDLTSSFRA